MANAMPGSTWKLGKPPPELVSILLPAYSPCPGFEGRCKGSVRWDPANGHIPCGFRGATGNLEEVKLVLVCAEPSKSLPGEEYELLRGGPRDYFRREYTRASRHLKHPTDQFARNIRRIIDMAWGPRVPFEEQMRKTWLTNAVLCAARKDAGPVPPAVETECVKRYLLAQLELFPDARIVALGGKAQQRLARAGVQKFERAWAAGAPGCNMPQAPESWRQAVAGLQP
jgi:hypothetical protein